MMTKIAETIISYLDRHNAICQDDKEVYIYGCDIALYTLLSTLGLFLIGAGFARLKETLILIFIFYLNQTIGGGYHATTHLRCFTTMSIGLIIYILILLLKLSMWLNALLGFLSLTILLLIPLVLHKNKQYLVKKHKKLSMHSRLIIASEGVAFLVIILLDNQLIAQASATSFALCAISRCVGFYLTKV